MSRLLAPQIDQLIQEFENQWAITNGAGELALWLDRVAPAVTELLLTELLQIDVCQRMRRGEPARFEEYLRQFPSYRSAVLTAFGFLPEENPLGSATASSRNSLERASPASGQINPNENSVGNQCASIYSMNWSADNCGPESILEFTRSLDESRLADAELIERLIQIDIENSWRSWRAWLDSYLVQVNVKQVVERRDKIHLLQTYLERLAHLLQPLPQAVDRLVGVECRSRDANGDAAGDEHYRAAFGLIPQRDPQRVVRTASCKPNPAESDRPASFVLQGITEFGRQRSTEPPPIRLLPGATVNRLIIADRLDSSVSRRQLQVELLTPNYAILTNLSESRSTYFSLEMDDGLRPQESAIAVFPFKLLVGAQLFHFG